MLKLDPLVTKTRCCRRDWRRDWARYYFVAVITCVDWSFGKMMELYLCNLDKFTRLMYPLNQTAIPVVPAETEQPNAEVAAGNIEIRITFLFGRNLQCRAHDSLTTILETFRSHGVVADMNSDLLLNPKECVYLFLNKTIAQLASGFRRRGFSSREHCRYGFNDRVDLLSSLKYKSKKTFLFLPG